MWKSSVLTILAVCFLLSCWGQELPDSLKQRNGTYAFHHKTPPPSTRIGTDYISILYLNDSMFAFTCNSKAFVTGEWMGIGRLINYNGKKVWLGVVDWDRMGIWKDSEDYLNITHVRSIQEEMKVKEGIWDSVNEYNSYIVLKFVFTDTSLLLDVLRRPGGKFHYDSIYIKKDNQKLDFTINKEYNWNSYKAAYDNYNRSIVTADCKQKDLPILEDVTVTNNNWRLQKGDTVAICSPPSGYMKYLFVIKYGPNFKIEKYGWILRSNLTPLKRVEVPSGVPPIIIKTKIVNGVRVSERVDKPKQ